MTERLSRERIAEIAEANVQEIAETSVLNIDTADALDILKATEAGLIALHQTVSKLHNQFHN